MDKQIIDQLSELERRFQELQALLCSFSEGEPIYAGISRPICYFLQSLRLENKALEQKSNQLLHSYTR